MHSLVQSEPAQGDHSPGQGSGTKRGEVEATRAVEGAADTLATVTPPRTKSPPPVRNIDSAPSRLPALESMSMSELRKEYFLRLSQHKELEGHLVQLMQRHHEVTTQLVHTFCLFVFVYCSPHAVSL